MREHATELNASGDGGAPSLALAQGWSMDGGKAWVTTALMWLLIMLMTVPDNFDYAGLTANYAPSQGSMISRLLWILLLVAPLGVILWRNSLAWVTLRWINPFLLALIALSLASLLWSDFPGITARRLIRVMAVGLNALAFVLVGWHPKRFQQGVRPALTAMLAGSIVFGIACPDLAIHHETSPELLNAWRGLTNHKNTLGDASSVGLILWLHAWFTRDGSRWVVAGGGAIAAACLVLSRSSTAMLATLAVAVIMPLMISSPPHWRQLIKATVVTMLIALVCYSIVILRLIPGMQVLLLPIHWVTGKDLTFSGRTDIWEIIVSHIQMHPWLGTGYGGYWIGPYTWAPAYEFVQKLHFYPGSSHNGYLEIINDLGIAGLVMLILYLCILLRDALRLYAFNTVQGTLIIALFFQQCIANLSETHWFSVLTLDFTIMTLATAALARDLLDQRLRQYFGEPVIQRTPSTLPARLQPALPMMRERHA